MRRRRIIVEQTGTKDDKGHLRSSSSMPEEISNSQFEESKLEESKVSVRN